MRKLSLLLLLISATVWAKPTYDFSAADQAMRDMITQNQLSGGSLRNAQSGNVVYLQYYGNYNSNTRIAIASASKWLSALVLARLVDKGQLRWTDTVGQWISNAPADKRNITIEQLFSHTAGMSASDAACLNNRNISLMTCAQEILNLPLSYPPGTGFSYGGNSMQVAAGVAEIASGKDWNQLFYDEVVLPLGMFDTDFATSSIATGYVWINNPRIAGGARSTIHDYGKVVDMVLAYGKVGQQTYLQSSTLAYMRQNQMAGKTIFFTPSAEAYGYGIGQWIERADSAGNAYRISSPGAFGMTPWVDLRCGCNGIIFIKDQRSQLKDDLYLIAAIGTDAMTFKRYIKPPVITPSTLQTTKNYRPKTSDITNKLDRRRTIR